MLEIKNLRASVEGNEILKGVNLRVREGEVHAIMGPNGSGKSTFANVIAGRILPPEPVRHHDEALRPYLLGDFLLGLRRRHASTTFDTSNIEARHGQGHNNQQAAVPTLRPAQFSFQPL